MRALAYNSSQVPLRYRVRPGALSVEGKLVAHGGSSEVREGRLGDKIVAVKILRTNKDDAPRVRHILLPFKDVLINRYGQLFSKECVTWMSISHQHILPLIAVDFDPLTNQYSMTSEMMLKGDIKKYISNNPATLNRFCLVRDLLKRTTGVEFASS